MYDRIKFWQMAVSYKTDIKELITFIQIELIRIHE